jgi:hypothetical protein
MSDLRFKELTVVLIAAPSKGMERSVKSVTPFACAKVAPLFPAAHSRR